MTTPTNQIRTALKAIAAGRPENPIGDPWAFYDDLVNLAKEALPLLDGHVLAPREPTEEMLLAAIRAPNGTRKGNLKELLTIEYKAMIAPYVPEGE